jgi:hypothetical protein
MAPTLLKAWYLLQSLSARSTGRLNHINYRSPLIERLGRPLVPDRSRCVHGNIVPYYVPAIMRSDQMRNQQPLVPELGGTVIGNARQRGGRRPAPVRRQHRFPDDKNAYRPTGKLLQNSLGCRGPLQTDWSSGRQEQKHPNIVFGGVKQTLDRGQVLRYQALEWSLAWRNPTATVEVDQCSDQSHGQNGTEDEFPFHRFTAPADPPLRSPSPGERKSR